jgi:hypothetical protein
MSNIEIGGLMRCCIESLKNSLHGENPTPAPGTKVHCDSCGEDMFFDGDTWKWGKKEDKPDFGKTTEHDYRWKIGNPLELSDAFTKEEVKDIDEAADLRNKINEEFDKVEEKDILEEALELTSGPRQNQYGPPDQDFKRSADMLTGLFKDKLKEGEVFEPYHIAQMQIIIKLSRQLHQRKRDNWVDIAGYVI